MPVRVIVTVVESALLLLIGRVLPGTVISAPFCVIFEESVKLTIFAAAEPFLSPVMVTVVFCCEPPELLLAGTSTLKVAVPSAATYCVSPVSVSLTPLAVTSTLSPRLTL